MDAGLRIIEVDDGLAPFIAHFGLAHRATLENAILSVIGQAAQVMPGTDNFTVCWAANVGKTAAIKTMAARAAVLCRPKDQPPGKQHREQCGHDEDRPVGLQHGQIGYPPEWKKCCRIWSVPAMRDEEAFRAHSHSRVTAERSWRASRLSRLFDREKLMKRKEVAKFFSGFAANQVLTHAAFAILGTRFTVLGIDYTPALNTGAAVFWLVLTALLIHYGWLRERPR